MNRAYYLFVGGVLGMLATMVVVTAAGVTAILLLPPAPRKGAPAAATSPAPPVAKSRKSARSGPADARCPECQTKFRLDEDTSKWTLPQMASVKKRCPFCGRFSSVFEYRITAGAPVPPGENIMDVTPP